MTALNRVLVVLRLGSRTFFDVFRVLVVICWCSTTYVAH
jgi:hypothetical protein